MFISFVTLMSALVYAAPIEIQVSESDVTRIEVTCGTHVRQISVTDGKASIPDLPGKCSISLIKPSGVIDGPGKYTCGLKSCLLSEVDHKPVTDEPGKINIILASGSAPNGMELSCRSGYRQRAPVERNTTIFENVPDEQCDLMLKGGSPLKFLGIGWGTYQCQASGSTLICTKR